MAMYLGSNLTLSSAEEAVNELLKEAIYTDMQAALETLNFPPSRNFMTVKQDIDISPVFAIIKDMPKGK